MTALPQDILRATFGERLHQNVTLAPYTSARIGGPADYLIDARNSDELADIVAKLWEAKNDFIILGGGSNVLVSDKGIRGIVVLNRAKEVRFNLGDQPSVWCESGAVLSSVAHRAAAFGLGGLEWAANVPGTVGGAVYGNAGAFGSDVAHDLNPGRYPGRDPAEAGGRLKKWNTVIAVAYLKKDHRKVCHSGCRIQIVQQHQG